MGALAFWKAVVDDKSNFLERVVALLAEHGIRYCVIDGVGVNAYAEPMVTQDLDIIIAADQIEYVRGLMEERFKVREFEHILNVYDPDSGLQVQVQRDPALSEIVGRARTYTVMELAVPVAAPEDLIELKVAAAREPKRRGSKRQKDLADIVRLVEAFPELRDRIPADVSERLFL